MSILYTTEVFFTLAIDGTHCWSTCALEEVEFLKYVHRHMFHIKCYKPVSHSDRDIEFIQAKHDVLDYLRKKYYNYEKRTHALGMKSCEMLATELCIEFELSGCEVNEDNENGAIVRKVPSFEITKVGS